MARIGDTTGFNYEAEYEKTENQGGTFELLPHMYAKLQAESIELKETKDQLGWQAAIAFEVIEPVEYEKRKFFEYWTIIHPDGYQNKSYKYGKPNFDRFGRAIGVEITAGTDTDNLTFQSFVAEVRIKEGDADGKGGKYKDKNQIGRFFYPDADAKEPVPELGVIGDGQPTHPSPPRTTTAPRRALRQHSLRLRRSLPVAARGARSAPRDSTGRHRPRERPSAAPHTPEDEMNVAAIADKYAPKLSHVPDTWGAAGHNNPPADEPTPYDAIRQEIEDLFLESNNWADGEPIANEKQADAVTSLLDKVSDAMKRADEARKEENRPFDEGKAEVQERYNRLIGKTTKLTGRAVLAKEALLGLLTPWRAKVDAEKRAEAERLAKEAADAAAAAQAAMQASRGNLEEREKAEELYQAAQDIERVAKRADKAASTKPACAACGRPSL